MFELAHGGLSAPALSATEAHLDQCPACLQALALVVRAPGSGDGVVAAWSSFPSRLERYVLLHRLGAGGMGIVFAAHDRQLERKVALKVIRDDALSDAERADRQARLLREERTMARLSHPNVVAVHDAGLVDDRVFVSMELIEGTTLRERLSAGSSSRDEVLKLFLAAGRGLAAAHAQDVVHRDFKPENVLLGVHGTPSFFLNGQRYLGDYGVEGLLEAMGWSSAPGMLT